MINTVVLMGRMVADAEMRTTTSGKAVARFTVAVDRTYSEDKKTDFLPCDCWNKTAEFVSKYFHRGDMIAVTGSLQSEQYKDKDGKNRTAYRVLVERASFCGGKSAGGNVEKTEKAADDIPENIADDDELPF